MAILKNTTINDNSNLTLPVGTTGQRPGSPEEGMLRYNSDIEEAEYYDGSSWRPISDTHPEGTGGNVIDTDIGGIPYRIHVFETTGNSTFTVTKSGEVEYLIVAGGGAGGGHNAGGGGAGGVLTGTTTVTPQSYTITVGAGGLAVNNALGNNGGNSSALGLTAIGGGRGGSQSGSPNGGPSTGGSGGGGGGTQAGAAGTAGQGNAGGTGVDSNATGGGGGGAGSAGGAYIANKAGNGGHGIYSDILGIGYHWAGGGGGSIYGGSGYPLGDAGDGGLGGGGGGGHRAAGGGIAGVAGSHGYKPGKAGVRSTSDRGGDAGENTGSGGGGSNGPTLAGNGGSGIVIIRYVRNKTISGTPNSTFESKLPLRITPPGKFLYNIRSTTQGIDMFYMDTPFDVVNRITHNNYNPVSQGDSGVTRIDNMAITNNGTEMYVLATNQLLNYKLRTPYDVSSMTLDYAIGSWHSATEPTCFAFADSGRKFYDHDGVDGRILQYELSIPYDVRSRTLIATITGLGFPNWGPGDPAFSPDGNRVAIGSRSRGQEIIYGACNVPFDLSTFAQQGTSTIAGDADPSCCKWNGDGTRLYVRHASPDMVNEIDTSANPYSLDGAVFVREVMPDTSFAAGGLDFNYDF